MRDAPEAETIELGALSAEERDDLQDAIDQDKELRWLEHDSAAAERILLDAPDGLRGEDLRKLHRAHRESQHRLAAAHAALFAFLAPQFKRRRDARLRGGQHVVFTREEFRLLNLEERSMIDTPGPDAQRTAADLRQYCRDMLEARGWVPRVPAVPRAGRVPTLSRTAWQFRNRMAVKLATAGAATGGTAAP